MKKKKKTKEPKVIHVMNKPTEKKIKEYSVDIQPIATIAY